MCEKIENKLKTGRGRGALRVESEELRVELPLYLSS